MCRGRPPLTCIPTPECGVSPVCRMTHSTISQVFLNVPSGSCFPHRSATVEVRVSRSLWTAFPPHKPVFPGHDMHNALRTPFRSPFQFLGVRSGDPTHVQPLFSHPTTVLASSLHQSPQRASLWRLGASLPQALVLPPRARFAKFTKLQSMRSKPGSSALPWLLLQFLSSCSCPDSPQ